MRSIRLFFIFAVVTLPAMFPLPAVVAQMPPPEYHFLDLKVVDSSGKPVADAAVEIPSRIDDGKSKTNRSGRLSQSYYQKHGRRGNAVGFSILKPGYFPFIDYFGTIDRPGKPLTIELLKIPKTRAERKAVGREQHKRELFGAAKTGDAAAVRKFLKSGLNPNLTTTDLRGVPVEKGVPVVVYAARSGNGETVSEFLRAGSIVRGKNEPIRGILAVYLKAGPFLRRYETKVEVEELIRVFETGAENLIKAGADANPPGEGKQTTLMLAAGESYLKVIKLLVEKGVPVNARDGSGKTALMYAITSSPDSKTRLETANLLLKSGADPDIFTNSGGYYDRCQNALMLAASNGDLEMIRLLLANRANVDSACENGKSALEFVGSNEIYVNENVRREILKLLEAAGAK